MTCSKCNIDTKVIDTRHLKGGSETRRRHKCLQCNTSFTTYERREDTESAESIAAALMRGIDREVSQARVKLLKRQKK